MKASKNTDKKIDWNQRFKELQDTLVKDPSNEQAAREFKTLRAEFKSAQSRQASKSLLYTAGAAVVTGVAVFNGAAAIAAVGGAVTAGMAVKTGLLYLRNQVNG